MKVNGNEIHSGSIMRFKVALLVIFAAAISVISYVGANSSNTVWDVSPSRIDSKESIPNYFEKVSRGENIAMDIYYFLYNFFIGRVVYFSSR